MDICLGRTTGRARLSLAGTSGRAQHGARSRRGPAALSADQTTSCPPGRHIAAWQSGRIFPAASLQRKSPNCPGLALRADPLVSVTTWICSDASEFPRVVTWVHCSVLLACGMYSHLYCTSAYIPAIYSSQELICQGFYLKHFLKGLCNAIFAV